MRLLTEARERLCALLFRARRERELDEELRFHLEMEETANLRKGLDPAEARRQAAITFGGVERVKEEVRDARGLGLVEDLVRDLRYAVRRLGRAPLTPVLVVLSLAIGVAVTSTMFSALDAFLLRPLPYVEADRLVRVWLGDPETGRNRRDLSVSSYEQLRERSRAVDLAAFGAGGMNLTGTDTPERLEGVRVTSNFFRVLAPIPLLGRTSFEDGEVQRGERVVVIGQGLWQRHFGEDRRVLGRTIQLDGQPYTIVGVMRDEFQFPHRRIEVYTPLPVAAADPAAPEELAVVGRLRAGVSVDAAARELEQLGTGSARGAAGDGDAAVVLMRLDRALFNDAFRTGAAICSVAVVFVLLIACSNAANLLLVRAATRQQEIAVRAALGAGRGRLVRQLLTESLVLGLAGGVVGAVLAYWGVRGLVGIMPADLPMVERIAVDGRTLVFTLGVSLFAGVVAGTAPAFHTTRRGIASLSRGAGRGMAGGVRASRLRSSIVITEIALALVLLIGAGLLIKGYVRATNTELGFETDNLLTLRVTLPQPRGPGAAGTPELLSRVENQLNRLPGVQGVALADALPLTRWGSSVRYRTPETGEHSSEGEPAAEVRSVAPGFFEAMRIGVRQGRRFTAQDRAGDPPVVVVNSALARTHWPDTGPIGRSIEYDGRTATIVGVVDDVNEWGAAAPPPRTIYAPLAQRPAWSVGVAVRSDLPVDALLPRLRAAVAREDPNLPLTEVATMATLIRESQPRNRLMARLLGIFASVAALLAVVGVYGVMAHDTERRRSEVGIRMAVGARARDIVVMMLGHGARVAAVGVLIGVGVAMGVARFLAAFMNGVSPFDPTTFAGVTGLLFAAAIVASLIPALRAARVAPLTALRAE